ncbi:hypothetical protein LPJ64_000055 [Coemansia asiatica]|uniref:SET domain-containing protein n=1 Tax=Coemansia asiatica TaxID=1052880 RepID=A0A9W8CN97_9FUNG|nr:hypothetical protein LPJ64_000055 [Coemansia asiatica]
MASDMAHETTNGQRLAAFVRWLEDNGADLGRIGVCDAGAEGNGVYAQQDISSNERYAYIPHKLVITGKVCQQTLGDGLQGRALLAAFLVHERFVAADSFWKPYIDILPQKYHTPLEFDSLELALLGGTPVEHAVEDRRSKYKEEHRAAQRATEGRIPGDVLTLENYVWAASAVSSRAFSKELVRGYDEQTASSEVLLPLLDMMNHQPRRRVTWAALDSGIEFVTGTVIKAGEQIFNNYGPKSNEELMMGFGFCVPGNPFSHFHIRLNYDKDPGHEDKQRLLAAAGIGSCDQFIRADGLPRGLLPMLRVMAMTDVDVYYARNRLQEEEEEEEGETWDLRRTLEYVGLHNELRARHLLLFLVQKKLAGFELAEQKLGADPATENARVARMYRDEIGEILRATVERLRRDEHELMQFACDLKPGQQTAMPWYARGSNNLIETMSDQPASKRARTASSDAEPLSDQEAAELEQRFLTTALITPESFAADPDFHEAISQMDVDPDVTLALFVVRVLTTAGTPWHDAVVRLHTVFRHPMMSTDQHCVDAYGEMLVEMGEIYDDLFPLLSDHFPEVFPIDAFTAERFVWAAAVVESFRVEVSVRSEKGCTVDAVCLL